MEKKNVLKIFSSETTLPIGTKLCWNGPLVVPFQNCVWWPFPQPKSTDINRHNFNIGPHGKNVLKIFSETACPMGTGMVLRWSSFRIVSDEFERQPKWPTSTDIFFNIWPYGENVFKIFSKTPRSAWSVKPNLVEWSIGGSGLELHRMTPTCIKDGSHWPT